MESFKIFYERYRNYVLIFAGILILFIVIMTKAVSTVVGAINVSKEYKTSQTALADKQRELSEIKKRIEEAKSKEGVQLIKAFYKPIDQGFDTEAVIANEFGEILMLIRANSVKARAINYTYDPADDNFVKGAKDAFNVAKLDIDMVANYKNFESFLKELYKHEHFLDISSIEITPYSKNKRFLLIKFQLKLYAKK